MIPANKRFTVLLAVTRHELYAVNGDGYFSGMAFCEVTMKTVIFILLALFVGVSVAGEGGANMPCDFVVAGEGGAKVGQLNSPCTEPKQ